MPTRPDDPPLPHLVEVDARLRRERVACRSLAPDRDRARDFVPLAASLIDESHGSAVVAAFDRGLAQVVLAVLENFPDNVFWDFDRLAAEMIARDDVERIEAMAAQVARLQDGFGRHGPISFRYAHDFLLGFDWARWAARKPEVRGSAQPFDDSMLAYLEQRMGELRELIAVDDEKYHRLDVAQRWRNPFGFSRDPADEVRLLERLAAAGELPVEAWKTDGSYDWGRPYSDLRRDAAVALGIAWET